MRFDAAGPAAFFELVDRARVLRPSRADFRSKTASPARGIGGALAPLGAPPSSEEVQAVARCFTCGNQYDKPIEVLMAGRSYVFDCFECAIHKLAPQCGHCGCRIIGHGVEAAGKYYCCNHCMNAAKAGTTH